MPFGTRGASSGTATHTPASASWAYTLSATEKLSGSLGKCSQRRGKAHTFSFRFFFSQYLLIDLPEVDMSVFASYDSITSVPATVPTRGSNRRSRAATGDKVAGRGTRTLTSGRRSHLCKTIRDLQCEERAYVGQLFATIWAHFGSGSTC